MALSPQQVSEKQKLEFPMLVAVLEERVDDALLAAHGDGDIIVGTSGERSDVVNDIAERFRKAGWNVSVYSNDITLSRPK